MALPQIVTTQLDTADDNGICTSQTRASAGNLTINGILASGGVATLDVARRVLITTADDETGVNFTITGTDRWGNTISETLAGVNNSTTYTAQDFKTVTQVYVDAALTAAVLVGTNGVGSSAWLLLNRNQANFNVGMGVVVDGTINYTVEYTYDDIMGHYTPGVGVVWNNPAIPTPFPVSSATTSKAVDAQDQLTKPCQAIRLTVNSGTGSATLTVIQSGIVG